MYKHITTMRSLPIHNCLTKKSPVTHRGRQNDPLIASLNYAIVRSFDLHGVCKNVISN